MELTRRDALRAGAAGIALVLLPAVSTAATVDELTAGAVADLSCVVAV